MASLETIKNQVSNVVTPVQFNTVEVDFGKGIVEGFASNYVSAINSKLALRGSSLNFSDTEMKSYLNLILKLRIESVNGRKVDYRVKNFLIPALYALSLAQIGMVYDKELGIQLTPVIKDIEAMTVEQAEMFSFKLHNIQDLGFELVAGLPKEKSGDINMMYFNYTDQLVTRHSSSAHPGYAVLASFFRMQQLENVLTYRVSYGLIEEYDTLLRGLIYDEGR